MKGMMILDSLRDRLAARPGWLAGLVIAAFLGLGLWYSLVVPPFETPDEIHHFAFARHLAQGHPLPVQTNAPQGLWAHEGTQPPLYYFLVGRLTFWIDQSDFDQISRLNPRANMGDPLYPGNKNRMLYSGRVLPLTGSNLAMHIGRWFSLLLAALTLLLVYRTARLAFPASRWLPLLALLIVASVPQFAFIGASVSNDNLVVMLSTAVVFWLARLLGREIKAPIRWWEWGVLGVLLGLAALSKLQGLGLWGVTGLALLGLAWLRRDWRLPLAAAPFLIVPAVAIAGWWYWRNFNLYGEWLGVNRLLTIEGLRTRPQTFDDLWGELRGLRYSFWGLFGWFSILMPDWTYKLLDMVTTLAIAGLAMAQLRAWLRRGASLHRNPELRVHFLLIIWAVILIGMMLYWATFAISTQGRLLFPNVSVFGVLLTIGLSFWLDYLPPRFRRAAGLLPVGLLACSLYALTVSLPASYRMPPSPTAVPQTAQPINLVYGEGIELLAAEIPQGRFRPGDAVPVTLYVRINEKLHEDHQLFVQLLDSHQLVLGNVTTHPGWGRNPTSLWQPGVIYADHYLVTIEGSVSNLSPLLARVSVGFLDSVIEAPLPVWTADGQPADTEIGSVQIVSHQALTPSYLRPANITFGQTIRVVGYDFPALVRSGRTQQLQVTLLWEAAAAPGGDYTAFVHLSDNEDRRLAGFDQAPAEGRFPTRFWERGDRSLSRFVLDLPADLPAGSYRVWVGLYEAASEGQARLPAAASSRIVKDDRVLLGTVEVR